MAAGTHADTSLDPQAYGAKGFIGKERSIPSSRRSHDPHSTHKKSPHIFMGTDPRDSADQCEAKAKALQGGGGSPCQ